MPADEVNPTAPQDAGRSAGAEAPDLGFPVALDVFSGPMDLLLFLVRRSEIEITDVSIATIADQFIVIVTQWQERLDLEVAGDFLVMATTLLEMKARAVAPPPELGTVKELDEEDWSDPRADLVSRLLAFRRFKEAAQILEEGERDHLQRLPRRLREEIPEDPDEIAGIDLGTLDTGQLFAAFDLLMARIGGLGPRTVVGDDVPLGVRIDTLVADLEPRGEARLREFLQADPGPIAQVTTVMASLEGARQRLLRLKQLEQYGDVWLRFRAANDRAVVQGDALPAEDLPRRRRSLPLATWDLPAGEAPAIDTDEPETDTEEPEEEDDDRRFVRELHEACAVDDLLARTADVETSFLEHWYTLHPELRPLPPPPPEPPPVVAEPLPAPAVEPAKSRRGARKGEKPDDAGTATPEGATPAAGEPAAVQESLLTELAVATPVPAAIAPVEPQAAEPPAIVLAEKPDEPPKESAAPLVLPEAAATPAISSESPEEKPAAIAEPAPIAEALVAPGENLPPPTAGEPQLTPAGAAESPSAIPPETAAPESPATEPVPPAGDSTPIPELPDATTGAAPITATVLTPDEPATVGVATESPAADIGLPAPTPDPAVASDPIAPEPVAAAASEPEIPTTPDPTGLPVDDPLADEAPPLAIPAPEIPTLGPPGSSLAGDTGNLQTASSPPTTSVAIGAEVAPASAGPDGGLQPAEEIEGKHIGDVPPVSEPAEAGATEGRHHTTDAVAPAITDLALSASPRPGIDFDVAPPSAGPDGRLQPADEIEGKQIGDVPPVSEPAEAGATEGRHHTTDAVAPAITDLAPSASAHPGIEVVASVAPPLAGESSPAPLIPLPPPDPPPPDPGPVLAPLAAPPPSPRPARPQPETIDLLPRIPTPADPMPAPPPNRFRPYATAALLLVGVFVGALVMGWLAPPRAVLAVVQAPPDRPLALDERIVLRFNLPVLPEKPDAKPLPLPVIEPAIEGRWTWTNRETLEFAPATGWTEATAYRITLPRDLRAAGGFRLPETTAPIAVRTAALAVVGVEQVGFTAGTSRLRLTFNQPVDPAAIAQAVTISGKDPAAKPTISASGASATVVELAVAAAPGPVELALPPGFRGVRGPLGLATVWQQSVVLGHQFTVSAATPATPVHGQSTIALALNRQPGRFDALIPRIRIEPALPVAVTLGDGRLTLAGEFVSGQTYRVEVVPAWPADEPTLALADLPAAANFAVTIPPRPAGLWLAADANGAVELGAFQAPAARVQALDAKGEVLATWDWTAAGPGDEARVRLPLSELLSDRAGTVRLVARNEATKTEATLTLHQAHTTIRQEPLAAALRTARHRAPLREPALTGRSVKAE